MHVTKKCISCQYSFEISKTVKQDRSLLDVGAEIVGLDDFTFPVPYTHTHILAENIVYICSYFACLPHHYTGISPSILSVLEIFIDRESLRICF